MTYKDAYIQACQDKHVILKNEEVVNMLSDIINSGENKTIEVHANFTDGLTLLIIKYEYRGKARQYS